MSLNSQITYLMKIAIEVNKKTGGTRAYEAEANSRDKFVVIRQHISKNFHFIRTKLDERERKKGQDATIINSQIRQKIEEVNNQLERMRESVASDKTATSAAQTIKYDLIEKLTKQTRQLQELIDTSSDLDRKLISKGKELTYTQMRQELLDKENQKQGSQQPRKYKNNAPTEVQMVKMKQWQKVDRQIDQQIEEVIGGIKRWKDGLNIMGELIKISDDKIVNLTDNVDKVNEDLFKSNKQLKGIIQKMRKPHKFCIDIILAIILVGLIAALIKMSSS